MERIFSNGFDEPKENSKGGDFNVFGIHLEYTKYNRESNIHYNAIEVYTTEEDRDNIIRMLTELESSTGDSEFIKQCDELREQHIKIHHSESDFSNHKYLIGQRALLNDSEVGIIIKYQGDEHNNDTTILVYSPSKGCASYYAVHNVKPLPNGQL